MAESELSETSQVGSDVRERVRERYADAARAGADAACCGSASCGGGSCDTDGAGAFGSTLYGSSEREALPDAAISLGCGNPTAVADLHEGEVVLDLGSGAGGDVLLSARRVGPTGHVYGLDMTDEMLALARRNARDAGVENVKWIKGVIEEIPLSDESVDVVISNCVINLSADKPRVLREAARVLRPGGRLAVTDIIADGDMDEEIRRDLAQWTGCIAGALTRDQFERHLTEAGLVDVDVRETHRVHEQAGSAIIRAHKPGRSK
jgi:arsenite methyltransferase